VRNQKRHQCILLAMACVVALWATRPCMALVVSELMYHPVEEGNTPSGNERLEFVELYNDQATSDDLSGYKFTNGIGYTFATGTILGPKKYVVVAREPNAVKAAYGISVVYGPFTGRLDNDGERIELSNCNGEIIISFRYNDTRPWPSSPDGTGHTLILTKFGGDQENASSWAPSTYIGGTPGGPDEAQTGPPEPNTVTLVDVNHPGRYFKGTQEPSPGAGGVPTIDWTKIGFNDDPSTTAWLNGRSGYGYSDEADELQWIRTTLDMPGKYISVYARLRFTLTSEQISSFSQLLAEVHYDDGFVLYLNGTEVARSAEIVGNPPSYNQSGGTASDFLAANVDLTSRMNLLVVGTNVLAIQAHNATLPGGSDCVSCPILRAAVEEPGSGEDPRARLVINELLSNSHAPPGTDWLEIYNPGPIAVDLNNVYLSDGRFDLLQYKIPGGIVLQPGQFWAGLQGTPPGGFPFGLAVAGETIFLTAATSDPAPKPVRVLDAVRFGPVEPDRTLGRFPDGADCFVALTSATYGAPNAKPLIRDIVINEIMYHHPTNDDRYEYVELYNKGASTVPLSGWVFTDGIEYQFGNISMAPGSYLVVAKDPNFLKTVYNNLVVGSNLVGPYTGNMADHSERVRFSYPIQELNPDTNQIETLMVTEDEVTYYDGGRWPTWADGQGASLELRDPRSNNNTPDAWADSDETSKTSWKQFSYIINSTDTKYTHDSVTVFDVILLNRGEVLLDDLTLVIGGTNRLTNNGFESGETSWRLLGNHTRSFVTTSDFHSGSRSLDLISTGHGDPGANRVNQSITSVTASTVTFSGWARWKRGTKFLLLRVTQPTSPVQPPRPSYAFELEVPLNLGTPGKQNTAFVSNRGPDILEVQHAPVLPAGNEPIVITARVTDNDGVSTVTLYYRSEGTTTFTSTAMVDNGSGDDLVAGDGLFTATIPGATGGTMRAFYITASDGSVSTRFPTTLEPSADVPNRTCIVRVGDTKPNTQLATYRVWISNDVINVFTSRANLSNELMDCTFVYNNTEVFYNCGIRFRGSPFIRSGSNRNPTGNYAYRINFNSDQSFRGCEEINLDNTEGGSRGPLQERASYWFYKQMGLQYSMQEYIRLISNGNNYGNYEDVQNIEGDYVDMWFPEDNDGYLHKIDDYFEYSADGTGYRNYNDPGEGLIYDSSHPLLKETYRWHFEKRSHREDDNWQHLFDFAVAMNTTASGSAYEQVIESVIDPVHFAKVLAIRHAVGDWDSYGYRRGKNNYFYYAAPEGKWYLLPWDIDFTLGSGDGTTMNLFYLGGYYPEVSKFLNDSKYRQMYLDAFTKLVSGPWQTSYGTGDLPTAFDRFLDDAANVLIADGGDAGRRDGIKQFVRDRRAYIITQIPPIAFEITTNSGDDFCTSASTIKLNGTAPLTVVKISVNGTPVTTQFSGNHVFEVEVALALGENLLVLQGLNSGGNPVSGAVDYIRITRVPVCSITSVTPSTACSNGTAQLTIHGSGFEPGSATSVTLTSASAEIGFDALYVQYDQAFDAIDAATGLLDDPTGGIGDPVYAVHTVINLYQTGDEGVFTPSAAFAPPFNSGDPGNFAVRFTGYIYAPSPGIRYFGVNSDDGFSLWIDGELVGEHAEPRGPETTDCMQNRTAGTMTFDFPEAGNYFVVLDFFENGGGEEIELFQTNSTGGNQRLINVDAELVVFRDNITRIEATNVVVANENTINCQVDLTGAEPDTWNVIVTPECGEAAQCHQDDVLPIIVCTSDFNHDSRVDFLDGAQLAGSWHKLCSQPLWCGGMDLDHSGSVDIGDLAELAEQWLAGASP